MDLQKSFCPKCGNNTLNRVTATVQNGQLTLFLKKNYQINNRGTQFSIPKHRGGRGNDMILREDQKEHLHALKLAKRFEKKAMSMDLADLDSIMFSKDRAILSGTGRPIIGHGRKNINHVQGRRRK
jgi:RNA-binding protein NOB1